MINESTAVGFKHAIRAVTATIIALIFISAIFASTAFAGMVDEYSVVINDNGNEYTIVTDEDEPTEILNKANIILGAGDRLDITAFEKGRGGVIAIDRLTSIHVQLNDVIKSFDVYADTVSGAFKEIGLDTAGCQMNYSSDAPVIQGMVITVSSPTVVTLCADGSEISVSALNCTVGDVLSLAGITLGQYDYTEPSVDTVCENEMIITVCRVEVKTVTETEAVAYATHTSTDDTMELGDYRIEVQGQNGEKEVTYEITYVNGEEVSRKELSSKVTKNAVDEVKVTGTKRADVVPNGVESKNGYTIGQVISGKYTHYCACAKCNGNTRGVTASGRRISADMENPYYIACNWLPLGTVLDVDGELYTVVDRGGSGLSKQGRIDIFTPGNHSDALRKGTGRCTITVVRLGW